MIDNGYLISDNFPAGVRQHRVLDDVPAKRLCAVCHVPDTVHSDVTRRPVPRPPHWCSDITTGQYVAVAWHILVSVRGSWH